MGSVRGEPLADGLNTVSIDSEVSMADTRRGANVCFVFFPSKWNSRSSVDLENRVLISACSYESLLVTIFVLRSDTTIFSNLPITSPAEPSKWIGLTAWRSSFA